MTTRYYIKAFKLVTCEVSRIWTQIPVPESLAPQLSKYLYFKKHVLLCESQSTWQAQSIITLLWHMPLLFPRCRGIRMKSTEILGPRFSKETSKFGGFNFCGPTSDITEVWFFQRRSAPTIPVMSGEVMAIAGNQPYMSHIGPILTWACPDQDLG